MEDSEDISDDGKILWSSLLQEVKEKSSKGHNSPCGILVMGNESSGKSCLIARLQRSDPKNGAGLEFEFIDVKDESMDENKQLNVWISSGDTFHSNLLKYALDENNFDFTLGMITVSFAEPWAIMESLEQWLDILKKHIDRLKLDHGNLKNLKESLSRHFQEYTEPEVDPIVPIVIGKRRDADFNYLHPIAVDDPERILLPLGDKVFEKNLGLPIVVVITKTDQITTLEQDFQYDDDKFDFIQMHIRQLCLKYGAVLCYTSLKDGRNCELLLRYLLHRCYGFPFIDTASVIEKDAVFIPAGWDNTNKINILAENLPEDIKKQSFDNFITKPLSLVRALAQNRMNEPEMADDEQVFLMKLQAQIQRFKAIANANPNAKPESTRGPSTQGSTMSPTGSSRNRKNLPGQGSVAVNPSNPGAQGNEGVLANFFSSLLNKRAVAGGPPLLNQQSTTSDSGKITENSSEAEDSFREDLKVEEIATPIISNVEENSSLSHHLNIIDERLQDLEEQYSNESNEELYDFQEMKLVKERNKGDNYNHKIVNGNVENMNEEIENEDDNSTNKEMSAVENSLAESHEDINNFVDGELSTNTLNEDNQSQSIIEGNNNQNVETQSLDPDEKLDYLHENKDEQSTLINEEMENKGNDNRGNENKSNSEEIDDLNNYNKNVENLINRVREINNDAENDVTSKDEDINKELPINDKMEDISHDNRTVVGDDSKNITLEGEHV